MNLYSHIAISLSLSILAVSAQQAYADTAIKSALDNNAPPYAMPQLDGSIIGLTVDMTNEIAKRLGRPITLEAMSFSNLIPAFQSGAYDMLSVPLTVTPERAKAFQFTEGLWAADLQFLLRRGEVPVTDLDQLRGKTIATNKGSSYDRWAREKTAEQGWIIESYSSLNEAALAVQAGRAQAALMDTATGLTITKRVPALSLSVLKIRTGQFYSYPVSAKSRQLRGEIEMAIECIKSDGTAARLYEKWLGVAPEAGSLEVTPQPGIGPVGLGNYDPTPHELACH